MNNEIIKAMNKKETKIDCVKKWWNKNGYKVMRIVLFPIWIWILAREKINAKLNARQVWSEERANEILSYYIPRNSEWDADKKEFYFFDNGLGWGSKYRKKKLNFKDRRWWNCHCGLFGGQIRSYLIHNFELEGFDKEVLNSYDSCTEIIFRITEK